MKLRLIAEAESELIETARYYERRQPGLGTAFVKTIWDAFSIIGSNPGRFPSVVINRSERDIHRFRVIRFPYLIVYEIFGSEVTVLAIAHGQRRPGYWAQRNA
jgi:plasmid stabilization system protein ParE